MTRRGWSVGIVGTFVCLVVAGCGGDPEPVVTPSPSVTPYEVAATVSPSPSPTPSPSATALTEAEILAAIPEHARYEDFPSSVQFARYFLESYSALFAPPYDARQFSALSTPDCQFCSSALESSEAVRSQGRTTTGGLLTWGDAWRAQGGLASDGYWYVVDSFDETDTEAFAGGGESLGIVEGGSGTVTVKLSFADGKWSVHGVNFDYADD
ncbi:hypothetical protein [Demequina sp.]|uniref:hypothetical protein n=1 Tax=Demequina sp. TaxID=2050685 RepID=UPI003A86A03A